MTFSDVERQVLQTAVVGVIIPQRTDASLLSFSEDESDSILDLEQRTALFFDEHLKVFVVLKIPQCDEATLKSCLSRLKLSLDIFATSDPVTATLKSADVSATRELLSTEVVNHDEDPMVLVSSSPEGDGLVLNLVWETRIVLQRPRSRLHEVGLQIVPSASISPEDSKEAEPYLEPFQTQEVNLFAALKGAKGFETQAPYFPVSRLESMVPVVTKDHQSIDITSAPVKAIRAYPAIITRLKYNKINTFGSWPSTIASVDLEAIPLIAIRGTITEADVSLANGTASSLMSNMLPIKFQSKDCITLLYRLAGLHGPPAASFASASIDVLTVSIKVTLDLEGGCRPTIIMEWSANIDFSHTSSNLYGPRSSSLHPAGRPLSLTTGASNANGAASTSPRRALDVNTALTISFSAPQAPVKIGVPFSWQVLLVNRTSKFVKLAVIPLPRAAKTTSPAQQFAKRHSFKPSRSSIIHNEKRSSRGQPATEEADIAPAYVDENIVYAMQHSGAVPAETDLLSLTPEMRVGPLASGQCYEGEIKFVAFKAGPLLFDAIRIVDLMRETEEGIGAPGVITDLTELPDVVVEAT